VKNEEPVEIEQSLDRVAREKETKVLDENIDLAEQSGKKKRKGRKIERDI
jgi:hypothetical protein